MKDEKDSNYYNNLYKVIDGYKNSPEDNYYYPLWKVVLSNLIRGDKILELGCGPGHFAELAFKMNFSYVKGIDFSIQAIMMAKERGIPDVFECNNIFNPELYTEIDYDVVVLTEVLEHIEDDLHIVGLVPEGKQIVATLPDFDAVAHVRHFTTMDDVLSRYGSLIEIEDYNILTLHHEVNGPQNFFIISGRRR